MNRFLSTLLLPLFALTLQAQAVPQTVTWSNQIAPIIYGNCSTCHHAGQVTPFTLMSYSDVAQHSATIVEATKTGYMPPWKPQPSSVKFRDERRLTADQISLLQQWVAAGLPEGDLSTAPPAPTYTDGWRLGTPDAVLTMPVPFAVPADGPDIYRNFVLTTNLPGDTYIRAIELRPTAQSAVHHVLFYSDGTGQARALDGTVDGLPGFPGFGSVFTLGLPNPITLAGLLDLLRANNPVLATDLAGGLGGWVPGTTPEFLPNGIAYSLPYKNDLILQTHFHPDGKPELEQTTVGLYFASSKPLKEITQIQAPSFFGVRAGIDIPANKSDYMVRGSFTLPVDVDAFSVSAHAHYLGKGTRMTATLPSGEVKILLTINDWNFSWQDTYIFKDILTLPAQTRIDGELVYDNSANNPNNPASPPHEVKWGENSTDEMGSLILNVVPHVASDSMTLRSAIEGYVFRGDPTPGNKPIFIAAGVVNAASAQPNPVSPGEIVTLYGDQLGASDSQVFFDGNPVPVIFNSANQINAIAPYALDGKSGTQVTVKSGSNISDPVALPVAATSPGIFAIVSPDGTPTAGSIIVIYATGEGQTNPTGIDGKLAMGPVYPAPVAPVQVLIGGLPAEVKYAGAAPTLIAGVMQVNAVVPAGLTPGTVPVQVVVGGVASQSGSTVTVK